MEGAIIVGWKGLLQGIALAFRIFELGYPSDLDLLDFWGFVTDFIYFISFGAWRLLLSSWGWNGR